MLAHFQRGSSEVDWCELNYVHSNSIAEFFNTISNAIFLVIPPFLMYLFRPYANRIGYGINVILLLMVVIGLCSAYFHATLSLVGQLLDELAILWVLMAAFALWAPRWLFQNGPFYGKRCRLAYIMATIGVMGTILGFIYPAANAFALMLLGIPWAGLLFTEVFRYPSKQVRRLGVFCIIWWFTALACWINDRIFCDMWKQLSFPYLHCGWHIFIFIASYIACVLSAYIYAASEFPQYKPSIMYWPGPTYHFAVPYVAVHENTDKDIHL
ncbi:predicted protein [Nematostella vectensis]|uniref:Alkaline ceramidase n=1 Tax=Nematostella vectensis TaxID=45351 RepID=A7RLT6_NEMVE|nr:alkaline ceramidase [Nematostella vectensis]EDO47751.1 predicted protein [Nematostella vectensis]|eukprot:XP_001639814.1 predicted protein [Nematostella vectensis]